MVRPDVAARKIARASAWLDDAEALLSRPVDEFVAAAKDRDLAAALRLAAGLRNRIAHGYAMLDYRRIHEESRAGIQALRQFLTVVAAAAGL